MDYGNGIPGTEGYRTQLSIANPNPAYDNDMGFTDVGFFWYRKITEDAILDPNYIPAEDDYQAEWLGGHCRCGFYEVAGTMAFGGRCIAVVRGAYDTVKLTVAETVQFICAGAFRDAEELAYVCLKGDLVTIHKDAFPPMENRWYTIVIRCSANCKDMYGRYYKDIAAEYGAVWEEWNG